MNTKILIIDTGFNVKYLTSNKIKFRPIHISDEYIIDNNITDINGHGTSIIDLYTKILPEAEYILLKAFDSENITENKLLYVLEYIYKNIECNIISLSGGLIYIENLDKLDCICQKLVEQGKYIVSAFDNNGALTFPAALTSVIGVDWNKDIKNVKDLEFIDNSVVNIRGAALHHVLLTFNGEKERVAGSSFVVPYVVKKIKDILENNSINNLSELLLNLKNHVKYVQEINESREIQVPFKINRAVIFPFIKEVETIARNMDQIGFEILDFFDYKHLRKVGKNLNDILNINLSHTYKIRDIQSLDWNAPFDTFILGHTDQITNIVGTGYVEKIISNCINYKKNLYLFDNQHITEETISLFYKNDLNVYYPCVDSENEPFSWICKLYMPSKPSIGIWGTSSKQGKFSLLLKMRKLFLDNGFSVGAIGTEPTSPLFGLDKTFPMGYNAHTEFSSLKSISIINYMIYEIEQKKTDVILFASQAHTIAPVNYCLHNIPSGQQNLLYAIRPDVCILCVNHYDELNYVKNTIEYLKALGNTIVLGIVISPVPQESQWWRDSSYTKLPIDTSQIGSTERFESLGVKVYQFNDKDLYALYSDCIKYLT